jgi:hypothetical protein
MVIISMYVENETWMQSFGEETRWKEPFRRAAYGRIILKWTCKKQDGRT